MASGQAYVGAIPSAEEGLFYIVFAADGLLAVFAIILDVVVDALGDEDQVGEAEVHCEGDDGGNELGPEGTSEVGDVPNEPHSEEGEGDAISRGLAVVFD